MPEVQARWALTESGPEQCPANCNHGFGRHTGLATYRSEQAVNAQWRILQALISEQHAPADLNVHASVDIHADWVEVIDQRSRQHQGTGSGRPHLFDLSLSTLLPQEWFGAAHTVTLQATPYFNPRFFEYYEVGNSHRYTVMFGAQEIWSFSLDLGSLTRQEASARKAEAGSRNFDELSAQLESFKAHATIMQPWQAEAEWRRREHERQFDSLRTALLDAAGLLSAAEALGSVALTSTALDDAHPFFQDATQRVQQAAEWQRTQQHAEYAAVQVIEIIARNIVRTIRYCENVSLGIVNASIAGLGFMSADYEGRIVINIDVNDLPRGGPLLKRLRESLEQRIIDDEAATYEKFGSSIADALISMDRASREHRLEGQANSIAFAISIDTPVTAVFTATNTLDRTQWRLEMNCSQSGSLRHRVTHSGGINSDEQVIDFIPADALEGVRALESEWARRYGEPRTWPVSMRRQLTVLTELAEAHVALSRTQNLQPDVLAPREQAPLGALFHALPEGVEQCLWWHHPRPMNGSAERTNWSCPVESPSAHYESFAKAAAKQDQRFAQQSTLAQNPDQLPERTTFDGALRRLIDKAPDQSPLDAYRRVFILCLRRGIQIPAEFEELFEQLWRAEGKAAGVGSKRFCLWWLTEFRSRLQHAKESNASHDEIESLHKSVYDLRLALRTRGRSLEHNIAWVLSDVALGANKEAR